ncbi:MAG: hypothetical protein E7536_08955 [Ruminococcaceae bacterium]|nr:hypothetical protein [Oscillospiraceae bacterium]
MSYYNYIRSDVLEMINESSDERVLKNKDIILNCIFAEEKSLNRQDAYFYGSDMYESENVVQLCAFKNHIKINEALAEFMKMIFKHPEIIFYLYKASMEETFEIENMVSLIPDMVLYFKNFSKNFLIKLDDISLCVYLQAVKNFGEIHSFSKEQILNWIPENHQCELKPTKWECKYFIEGKCTFESDKTLEIFEDLLKKGVFKPYKDGFIINF